MYRLTACLLIVLRQIIRFQNFKSFSKEMTLTRDSWIEPGEGIVVKRLDWFNLEPDFIKIDTEGFEYFIIQGGEHTIRTHRPVMIVEQKPGKGSHFGLGDRDAIDLLESWGYRVAEHKSGDYVCVS